LKGVLRSAIFSYEMCALEDLGFGDAVDEKELLRASQNDPEHPGIEAASLRARTALLVARGAWGPGFELVYRVAHPPVSDAGIASLAFLNSYTFEVIDSRLTEAEFEICRGQHAQARELLELLRRFEHWMASSQAERFQMLRTVQSVLSARTCAEIPYPAPDPLLRPFVALSRARHGVFDAALKLMAEEVSQPWEAMSFLGGWTIFRSLACCLCMDLILVEVYSDRAKDQGFLRSFEIVSGSLVARLHALASHREVLEPLAASHSVRHALFAEVYRRKRHWKLSQIVRRAWECFSSAGLRRGSCFQPIFLLQLAQVERDVFVRRQIFRSAMESFCASGNHWLATLTKQIAAAYFPWDGSLFDPASLQEEQAEPGHGHTDEDSFKRLIKTRSTQSSGRELLVHVMAMHERRRPLKRVSTFRETVMQKTAEFKTRLKPRKQSAIGDGEASSTMQASISFVDDITPARSAVRLQLSRLNSIVPGPSDGDLRSRSRSVGSRRSLFKGSSRLSLSSNSASLKNGFQGSLNGSSGGLLRQMSMSATPTTGSRKRSSVFGSTMSISQRRYTKHARPGEAVSNLEAEEQGEQEENLGIRMADLFRHDGKDVQIFGRSDEQRFLCERLEQLRASDSSLTLLLGEIGLGKTVLVNFTALEARRIGSAGELRVAMAIAVSSEEHTPFFIWRKLLWELLDLSLCDGPTVLTRIGSFLPESLSAEVSRSLCTALCYDLHTHRNSEELSGISEMTPNVTPGHDGLLPPPTVRLELIPQMIVKIVVQLASVKKLVILIENLQYADVSSIELLIEVVRSSAHNVFVLVSSRPMQAVPVSMPQQHARRNSNDGSATSVRLPLGLAPKRRGSLDLASLTSSIRGAGRRGSASETRPTDTSQHSPLREMPQIRRGSSQPSMVHLANTAAALFSDSGKQAGGGAADASPLRRRSLLDEFFLSQPKSLTVPSTPRNDRAKSETGPPLSPGISANSSAARHGSDEGWSKGEQQRAVVEASAIASMSAASGNGTRRFSLGGDGRAEAPQPAALTADGEGDTSRLRAVLFGRLKELPRAQCIWVPALDQATMVDLVAHRLSLSGPLPFRTAAIVWERSAGHPLLALEVTWEMVRSKLISLAGGECKESHELLAFRSEELKLPSSMAAVAAARIDQLSMRQQMIVKIASVFFGPFRKEQLVQLCREANLLSGADSEVEAIVTAELQSLTRGGIVQVRAYVRAWNARAPLT
jgi:hypothetical protein